MPTAIRAYVRSLGLDAYVVGGAVRDELLGLPHRDEDFLVPGVDQAGLRALLEPHGKVEDMAVHGQLVGVRLFPRDAAVRALAPAGIELTPPRAERSTGPGHRDFAIVSDPSIGLDEDMGRRDFTINAMALRLEDGTLVDPFDGRGDLDRRVLRTVGPTSFRDDPLRLVRALRLVSQLGFGLAADTEAQMREGVAGLAHVSPERIGGGIKADGMGELSKLLLGRHPAHAILLARDTGVLAALIPEFAPAIGHRSQADDRTPPLEEHLAAAAQAAADADASLEVRLAALLHDLGIPAAEEAGTDHAALGADIAGHVVERLRYPTRTRHHVVHIVARHAFPLDVEPDAREARRFLADHGDALALDLLDHRRADLAAERVPAVEHERLAQLRELVEGQRGEPHRIGDLAVSGADLMQIGFTEGPALGRVLRTLLDEVVDDPARNERRLLLSRARELM